MYSLHTGSVLFIPLNLVERYFCASFTCLCWMLTRARRHHHNVYLLVKGFFKQRFCVHIVSQDARMLNWLRAEWSKEKMRTALHILTKVIIITLQLGQIEWRNGIKSGIDTQLDFSLGFISRPHNIYLWPKLRQTTRLSGKKHFFTYSTWFLHLSCLCEGNRSSCDAMTQRQDLIHYLCTANVSCYTHKYFQLATWWTVIWDDDIRLREREREKENQYALVCVWHTLEDTCVGIGIGDHRGAHIECIKCSWNERVCVPLPVFQSAWIK